MNEDFLWWVGEKKLAGSCLSVCVCVQAFPGTAPERLVRSGPGWHRSTRRNAGTSMVPVAGRPAARGTCRPVKDYQKFSRAPGGQTGAATEPKLAGHTRTVPT